MGCDWRWAGMRRGYVAALAAFLSLGIASPQTAPQNSQPAFETAVLPIFKNNCQQCHGPDLQTKQLNLSTYEGIMKGSESGPVVVPGKPGESLLYKMVHEGKMPPGGKKHLTEGELAAISAWIESGAHAAQRAGAAPPAEKVTQFDVLPVLALHCSTCHGIRRQAAGLDLRSRASILKGGKSGPAMTPGQPEESLIVKKVRSGEMPPKAELLNAGVKPMSGPEIDKLAHWIAEGAPETQLEPDGAGTAHDPLVSAKDRQFWSFQPPRRYPPPHVRHADRVGNAIDAFILQKLEEKGAALSPEASRLTLIRRATFDLTGLPPTPEEVQAFVADQAPNAYEKLIDRLLASPRYGEKWGRHWLDLAGYADSEGGKLSADLPRPYAWRYRDYVIRAFNSDKPYDRFLLEQIAGDELADYEHAPVMTQELEDNLIATGFLRMAGDSTSEREVNFAEDRLDVVADEMDVLASGVMGLTLKCARCHSHKYDPIPQRDYYRLTAIFRGAYDETDWITPVSQEKYGRYFPGRFLPYVTPGATPFELMQEDRDRETRNQELEAQIRALKTTLDEKAEPAKKKLLEQRLQEVPENLREDLRTLFATPPQKRTETQKFLAGRFEKVIQIKLDDAMDSDPAFAREAEGMEKKIKLLEAKVQPPPRIRALWDRGEPSQAYLLRRGSASSFGPPVEPGVLSALADGQTPFAIQPPWPGAKKTGRRLAFARWLVRPDNPLTARVMVNRIWKYHFGAGIVKSLGNFGKTGAPPSHPELLDWLATEFVRQGWSIKAMQRLMMTSNTYRQSSDITPAVETLDPSGRLLSRMPLRRMEAEELNDTLLLVAGKLDETRFGPPDPVLVRRDGLVTPIGTDKGWRRSIYVNQRRSDIPTLLENFDLPPMSPSCLERSESTVAPQALNLMNNGMVRQLAADFARRLQAEAGQDPARQVERAYWIAFSRPPGEEERKASLDALARFAQLAPNDPQKILTEFCHMLMNSAAFLYID